MARQKFPTLFELLGPYIAHHLVPQCSFFDALYGFSWRGEKSTSVARMARVVLPGYPHHVTQRGVRSMDIFWSKRDRDVYIQYLLEEGQRSGLTFLAYCLMTNHVHLVAVPDRPDSLARGIGETHRRYARFINFRDGVKGHLFQARFFSCPLDEPHFVAAVRYVERNPVRAGLEERPWDYPWSSAGFRIATARRDPLVCDRQPFDLAIDWKDLLLTDPKEAPAIRESTRTGRPCGNRWFMQLAEEIAGRTLQPQKAGRPRQGPK